MTLSLILLYLNGGLCIYHRSRGDRLFTTISGMGVLASVFAVAMEKEF